MKKTYIQPNTKCFELKGKSHLMTMSAPIDNSGITSGTGDAKEEEEYYFGW